MKKLKLIFLALMFMMFVPQVDASTVSASISGKNSVTVGSTVKIYIKANASDKIEGADVSFSTSGNISVTNVSVGSGLSTMGQDGNRYILYAANPLASGSTILILTVKGTAVGKGTITVNQLEATVSGETAYSGSKSYNITVKEKSTTTTPEKEDTEELSKISKATTLVEAVEKSLLESDYNAALNAVKGLKDGTEKTKLLQRLEDVLFKIEVNKACTPCEDVTCIECEDCSATSWIILCIVLSACLLGESAYLVYTVNKKKK